MKICCLCGMPFTEWGNDPWPIKEEGRCCDKCNNTYVISARIKNLYKKKEEEENV